MVHSMQIRCKKTNKLTMKLDNDKKESKESKSVLQSRGNNNASNIWKTVGRKIKMQQRIDTTGTNTDYDDDNMLVDLGLNGNLSGFGLFSNKTMNGLWILSKTQMRMATISTQILCLIILSTYSNLNHVTNYLTVWIWELKNYEVLLNTRIQSTRSYEDGIRTTYDNAHWDEP